MEIAINGEATFAVKDEGSKLKRHLSFRIAPTQAFSVSENFLSLLFLLLSACSVSQCRVHKSTDDLTGLSRIIFSQKNHLQQRGLRENPVIIERVYEIKT